MIDNLEELYDLGINSFRIDFTLENEKEVKEVIESYIEVLENDFDLGDKSKVFFEKISKKGLTTGHYYKGVE